MYTMHPSSSTSRQILSGSKEHDLITDHYRNSEFSNGLFSLIKGQEFWVQEGQQAWLDCVSDNFESKVQKWIGPSGKELTFEDDLFNPRYRIIGDYNLEILNVRPSDQGLYYCIVSDRVLAAYKLHVIRTETTPGKYIINVNCLYR